ncbi:hypothetical protein EDD21DRAFT_419038 [Dissophora ornata]|nr:hypothetical protein EDD21DRAFT_419038 [Dissophora ornata]
MPPPPRKPRAQRKFPKAVTYAVRNNLTAVNFNDDKGSSSKRHREVLDESNKPEDTNIQKDDDSTAMHASNIGK